RPPRDRAARLRLLRGRDRGARGRRRRRPGAPGRAARALRHPRGRGPPGRGRRLRLPRHDRHHRRRGDRVLEGVSYRIGEGNMLEGLDEALIGLSAEETTTFVSKLAGGDRAGEEAQVKVTAQSVKVRELPEADDEFAEMASEFDT